ncbi:ClpX C4-type zinc finger protein [Georgenia alba]|uniref:ClpX C4-type zinc finger protein n=1 Tax=Georgenia alba TaxID=2233858 RepID=A0ABW2QD95_9MICO
MSTTTATAKQVAVHCSFCGKEPEAVSKLIAGPGIYICDGCVSACNAILETHEESSETPPPPWEAMSAEEILAALPKMARVGDQVEAGLRQWIGRLRQQGVTWSRIGESLGMTRQSAWGRFSGEE